jgi:2,4-dienoyl-CoA reductase-like NADH-dependent reductase (Old Yellow Enzyme family)
MAAMYPNALSAFTLGQLRLRNRIVCTAHQTTLVHDHLPTDDLVAYHAARAEGGVGAIFLEATAVHESGLLTSHTLGGYLPAIVDGYRRLADVIHGHGATVLVQLFHGGREQISVAPRPPALAPSAIPTQRFHVEPRAITAREIKEILAGFERAARLARDGGLDGIEISAAHGYLAAQFFTSRTNRRSDSYAATAEGRLRFLTEALTAVRKGAGSRLAVGVRLSADEVAFDQAGPDECAQIAGAIAATGLVDFVSAALGHSSTYLGSTYIVPPPPVDPVAVAGPAWLVRLALPRSVPLIATTRVTELAQAEALIEAGVCDLVGMTRAHIADPDLVSKSAAGRPVIPCIGCNQGCIGHYHAGLPIACTVNVRTGRERVVPRRPDTPQASDRTTVVVGGGPAGIAAALEAAAAGDRVRLIEASEELGGQLRIAGKAPGHRELWSRYLQWVSGELDRRGVEVALGVPATAADCADAHRIVLATGALPYRPDLVRTEFTTINAWDAIEGPELVSGPVLVADWGGGWDGLDAAEVLAGHGRRVVLAVAATQPGETLHQYQRNLYLGRLDRLGVSVLAGTELAAADGRPVLRNVFSGRASELPELRTLVLAAGRVPNDGLWAEMAGRPGVVRAGDMLGPRSMEEAILEGTAAGR